MSITAQFAAALEGSQETTPLQSVDIFRARSDGPDLDGGVIFRHSQKRAFRVEGDASDCFGEVVSADQRGVVIRDRPQAENSVVSAACEALGVLRVEVQGVNGRVVVVIGDGCRAPGVEQ